MTFQTLGAPRVVGNPVVGLHAELVASPESEGVPMVVGKRVVQPCHAFGSVLLDLMRRVGRAVQTLGVPSNPFVEL